MRRNTTKHAGDNQESGLWVSLRNASTFASLKVSAYRLFWASQVFEVMGMTMLMMVRSLLAYRLTGSMAIIGIIALFQAIPNILIALFGGVIADRFQKKYMMLIGELGMVMVSLLTAITLITGYLSAENEGSWWVLAVGATFHGIISGMMAPSRQAIIPEFVGEERLMNATSLLSVGTSSMQLLVPTAAGFLIDTFDFHTAYFTMTVIYSIASIFILRFPLRDTISTRTSGTFSAIIDGIRYVRRQRTVLIILVITLASVLLSMPYRQLLAVFADDVLNVGASGLGILTSLSGAGAVIGAFLLASLPNKKRGLMLILSGLISGISLMAFSTSTSWPLSLGTIIFVGLGQTGRMALGGTLIQYYIENEYRGRVMSIFQMQMGLTSFGTFLAGILSDSIGVQWAIGGFAAVLVFISLLALAFLPQVRRLD